LTTINTFNYILYALI